MPAAPASSSEVAVASDLAVAVVKLRRRLVSERDPANHLSMTAMAVLGALSRDGDLRIGELASREGVRPPSMTRTVNGLERLGHVTKRPSDNDGRSVVVSLSDSGRAVLRRDRRTRDEWLARRLRELSPAELKLLRAAVPILLRIS